ncbi:hypothetical protein [Phenylobacterium sp.]|uniref:hypothetical protein n=1 Tax=Phenylobacterium sp. TaxID=1871053 RepID=UPI0027330E76|nr:hypothetical protein [Phenylobacterium sp.]MDP3661056.1 hypothetical protein [Phenylobacterium sp.]
MTLGGLGLLIGGWICLGLMADPQGGPALYYIGPLFMALSTVFLLPAFFGGLLTLRGSIWGRTILIALSGLLLLVIPVGTVLGGFGLWALLRPGAGGEITPRSPTAGIPAAMVPAVLRHRRKQVVGMAVAMAAVGSGFIVLLGAGFRLNHQPPPGYLDEGFYPAIALLIAIIAFVVIKRPFEATPRAAPLNPFWLHRYRRQMRRDQEAWQEQRRQRIALLAADPIRSRYAALIEAGGTWSDAEIAYDMDPDAVVTCRHLQPIERAMRRAEIDVHLVDAPQVRAACVVDQPSLIEQFPLPKSVTYREMFLGGRSAEDDPVAFLICDRCQSTIDTLHPQAARNAVRWFPQAPAPEYLH